MPNIREYVAPNTKLTPDEKGYAAWETAGRRIGPLYGQMAAEEKEAGRINADVVKQQGAGQKDLFSQAEHLTDEDVKDLSEEEKKSRGGGGFDPGQHGGGGGGRAARQPSDQPDPLEYAQALRQASAAAAKHGALGGGGSLDELQWMLDNGKSLTGDQRERMQMLQDIQDQKVQAQRDALTNQAMDKKYADYFAGRDQYIHDWTFGGAQAAANAITGADENYLPNAIASGRDTYNAPPTNGDSNTFFQAAWDRASIGAGLIGDVVGNAALEAVQGHDWSIPGSVAEFQSRLAASNPGGTPGGTFGLPVTSESDQ